LPKKNIDTGMGLERTAAVIQGKRSFYDTDLFAPLMQKVSQLTQRKSGENEKADRAIRIIAEHGRAVTFLITDGVIPSNEGRGYVLRRILRRAALFGRTLGLDGPFLGEVAKEVVTMMGYIYPELMKRREAVLKVIDTEEARFGETLSTGLPLLRGILLLKQEAQANLGELEKALNFYSLEAVATADKNRLDSLKKTMISGFLTPFRQRLAEKAMDVKLPGASALGMQMALTEIYQKLDRLEALIRDSVQIDMEKMVKAGLEELKANLRTLSGGHVFELYDTYGFPSELTAEVAAENGLTVDMEGFEKEMERQRERARAAHKFVLGEKATAFDYASMLLPSTEFVGYKRLSCNAKVLSLVVDGKPQEAASEGEQVEVVMDMTPFYAEMGGQVADTGEIIGKQGKLAVSDTVWANGEIIVHRGKVVDGAVFLGEKVAAEVDQSRRLDIARNHTATHLLHAALRQVLGSQVHQAGSLVAPDRFRFDFTCEAPVLKEELSQIQRIVNEGIRRNLPVTKKQMPHSQAVAEGAIALFGEKYGDVVRTVKVGRAKAQISFEVCGGTHVDRTGDIGFFQVISEGSIGSGMRRIEAVTGREAEKLIEERASMLDKIAHKLQAPATDVEGKLSGVLEELDSERKRAIVLERQLSKETAESLLNKAETVKGVSVLATRASVSNMDALRHMGDVLREKLGSGVIVLAAVWDDRPSFLAMVTPDLVAKGLDAGDIVKKIAQATGGSGGGRPQLGQGGGKDKDKLEQALKLVAKLVEEKV
jgi:alanyl-tRNA synthetase